MADVLLGAARYERIRLAKMAGLVSGRRILDVGYARRPNETLLEGGRHVTGLDLRESATPSGYQVEIVGDVFDVGTVAPGPYDTIVAAEFIEHVEQPFDLIRTLRDQLADDGQLIISTPNPLSFPVVAFELIRDRRRFYSPAHRYYFAPRWVEKILTDCDMTVTDVVSVGLWPYALPCPVGLSYQVIYVATPNADGRGAA